MKKPLKSNQRRKLLNRQHNKMTSRRQSYFNQTITKLYETQENSQLK